MKKSTRIDGKKTAVFSTFKRNLKKAIFWQFSWMLGSIGLLLVVTHIPYPFIDWFIYFFIHLLIFLFDLLSLFSLFFTCFNHLFYPFTTSFIFFLDLFYIIYVSISLFHYLSNLVLLVLQYHYLYSNYVFTSYKLIVFLLITN